MTIHALIDGNAMPTTNTFLDVVPAFSKMLFKFVASCKFDWGFRDFDFVIIPTKSVIIWMQRLIHLNLFVKTFEQFIQLILINRLNDGFQFICWDDFVNRALFFLFHFEKKYFLEFRDCV